MATLDHITIFFYYGLPDGRRHAVAANAWNAIERVYRPGPERNPAEDVRGIATYFESCIRKGLAAGELD